MKRTQKLLCMGLFSKKLNGPPLTGQQPTRPRESKRTCVSTGLVIALAVSIDVANQIGQHRRKGWEWESFPRLAVRPRYHLRGLAPWRPKLSEAKAVDQPPTK